MSVTPALSRLRQEDHDFETSLGNTPYSQTTKTVFFMKAILSLRLEGIGAYRLVYYIVRKNVASLRSFSEGKVIRTS